MEIIFIDDCQANLELTDLEITIIHNVLIEVETALDHEPEFKTRVGIYYSDAQELIGSLSNNCIVDLEQVTFINNILNEVCNGINIKNFDTTIGIPKVEAKSYLRAFNQVMNKLRS